jgi:hypothetical protein
MTTVSHNKSERQLATNQLISKIKKFRVITVLTSSYFLALLVMFLLPLFNVPEYSIIRNTISELGAQSAPNAWIMNIFRRYSSIIFHHSEYSHKLYPGEATRQAIGHSYRNICHVFNSSDR